MNYKERLKIVYHQNDGFLDFDVIDTGLDISVEAEERTVVRGIAIQENKILVVYPKDEVIYGTPGGGVEDDEDLVQALEREMLEEVGAKRINVLKYIGSMKSYRKMQHSNELFVPKHHFFLVEILEFGKQELIQYEEELGLQYEFKDIDEVIEANELALAIRKQTHLDFYTNQTILFKELKKRYFK